MAWEIAVIVDPAYNPLAMGSLGRDMMLWLPSLRLKVFHSTFPFAQKVKM